MTFKDLMGEIKGIEFDTVRVDSYYYFEAVILGDKVPLLKEKLDKVFGEQVCPSKKKLTADIQQAIEDFGGIRDDQVLYFIKEKDYSYFAMLWPWTDEYHITVKVGREMRTLPFSLVAAALALSFAPLCHAEGLGTLMQVGKSMDDADRTLSKETAQFEKVKADLDKGEIKKGMAQSEVMKAYGEPQVAFKDSLTKRDKWVYKPGSSNYFEGDKIYVFFDDEGLVDETRYINK